MDALPPDPPAHYSYAPGDIYPRGDRERELCFRASRPDWLYLGALAALDVGAVFYGTNGDLKYSDSIVYRFTGPIAIGLAWGATIGGGWLALPKCDMRWVGEPAAEGDVGSSVPLALSLALLAGATAPVINATAIGYALPDNWSTLEREMHVVAAGLAGFGGALLPYLLPPRTWRAQRELMRIRLGTTAAGGPMLGYTFEF